MSPKQLNPQTKQASTLELLLDEAMTRVGSTMHLVTQKRSDNSKFDQLLECVSALPIAMDEFGLLRNRIRNAQQYSDSSEFGACRFELGLLKKNLDSIRDRLS